MSKTFYIVIGCMFLIGAIVLIAIKQKNQPNLPSYSEVPVFSFTNSNGELLNNNVLNGKVYVVDFFFTTCATICIDMSANLMDVQEAFKNNDHFQILSFTVDPEYDTNEILNTYAERHDSNPNIWNFITDDKKKIYDIARHGFKVVATEGDGGPGDFIHTNKFIVVDKNGTIRGYYNGTDKAEVQRMISEIKDEYL